MQMIRTPVAKGSSVPACPTLRILDDTVAEQAVRADRGELATAVDQDAGGMPAGDLFVDGAEGGWASDRQTRRDRARPDSGGPLRFVACSCSSRRASRKWHSAKPGYRSEDCGVSGGVSRRIARLGGAGFLDILTNRRRSAAAPWGGVWTGWARNPLHWPGGRSGPAGRRSVRNTATIASSRRRKSARMSAHLRRAALRRVDELVAAGKRRAVQPVLADALVGQSAERRSSSSRDRLAGATRFRALHRARRSRSSSNRAANSLCPE